MSDSTPYEQLKNRLLITQEAFRTTISENGDLRYPAAEFATIKRLVSEDELLTKVWEELMMIMKLKHPEWMEDSITLARFGEVEELIPHSTIHPNNIKEEE